ncbi:protein dispatched homolog 1-like [Actinia tenebrosa]|uniref:Protein dispatched homolog 1-like n=1 Tax=Actinia tenebrosa TaxID=6105 RepID=A0A6P8HEA1_ACTTE|nr:protein dispatched homolog 1-like [Actinia tenebrosa]
MATDVTEPSTSTITEQFEMKAEQLDSKMRCTKEDLISLALAVFIPILITVFALFSLLPSLKAPPLPSFEDPIKGFEPRGTELSNRLITLKNLNNVSLSKFNGSQAKTRNVRSVNTNNCRMRKSYVHLVFQSTSTSSLLTAKNLKAMCVLEKKVMKSTSGFDFSYYGGCPECCPSLSLGNLVAKVGNKGACENITDFDVQMGLKILQNCSVYYAKGLLNATVSCYPDSSGYNSRPSIPCQCIKDKAVFYTLNYLTDSDFLKTLSDTNLKYSLVMSPIVRNYDLFYHIYETHLKDTLPEYNGVKVVAFHFENFKFDLFNNLLIENTKYPAIAMVFVLIIMCSFLNSIILSICTLFCIIFALVFSYFLYNIVFGVSFFPFLNVITLVFLVGIGADDAFVYYDIWRQTKLAHPDADVVTLTFKTLRYAALSMFVTSFTTSAAFFASVTSHITSIKCFGIFAGLSILTNYLIMVTWFPVVVILHERWVRKRPVKPSPRQIQEKPVSNNINGRDGGDVQDKGDSSEPNNGGRSSLACLVCWAIDFPCHFIPGHNTFFSKMNQKLFDHWLPNAVLKKRLHFLWIFLFFGLTIGFLCVIFVKPGLNLPTSKDFQVFAASSNVEKYDLGIKYKFRFNQVRSWGLPVHLVWGLKEVDNGDYLNPNNKGTLEYNPSFDPFSKESQKWMLSLCKSLQKQRFYTTKSFGESGVCAIKTFIKNCRNYTFPFPREIFQNACFKWAGNQWSEYPRLLYDKNKKALVMTMWFETNVQWTAAYDKMDDFWKSLKTWESEIFATAPSGMKNGWLVSYDLEQMYNLQDSLKQGTFSSMGISVAIAFCVMLLTTLNIFISIYAIVTIIGIIAISVGCLVLLGWQLNILESIVMAVAVGLSIDFTMHYGVAYRLSPHKENRELRVRYSFSHIGSAISMAALTTFITGLLMMPAIVLVYNQLGQFLMLLMVFSWLYATFAFLSLCAVIGPVGNFGQLSLTKFCSNFGPCRVKPASVQDEQNTVESKDVHSVQTKEQIKETDVESKDGLDVKLGDENERETHL